VTRCINFSLLYSSTSPDLEAFSSAQLKEWMDDDASGPVSNGDPMLSSPHLSPVYYGQNMNSSPASSSLSHYSDQGLSPSAAAAGDAMDMSGAA